MLKTMADVYQPSTKTRKGTFSFILIVSAMKTIANFKPLTVLSIPNAGTKAPRMQISGLTCCGLYSRINHTEAPRVALGSR